MKIFLVILLAAGAAVGFVQQRRIAETRTRIEEQSALAMEADRLRKENDEARKGALNPEQIAAMRAERSELMRLRAGIGDLRVAAQTPEKVEAEIVKLSDAATEEEKNAKFQRDTYTANQMSRGMHGTMQIISSFVQVTARANGGKVPRSFEEVKEALKGSGRFPNFDQMWEGFPQEHFEFVAAAASRDGILIVRERQPRQLPDGTWARYYLTTDYQVNELKLKDGHFAAWERENFK
jgi:hypothetical protein